MKLRHLTAAVSAAVLTTTLSLAAAPSASATTGTRSLAEVLTSDGNRFDRNWSDYDITTEAVLAVLAAKPASPVGLLTQGSVPLTAFIPNDLSFQVLVHDLTGRWYYSEEATFNALAAAVGIDAIEAVLLYHVIPGATIDSAAALASDGAALTTAQGGTLTVNVLSRRYKIIRLVDNDPNDVNPVLNPSALDLNRGNAQIAHGIFFVLRPADL